MSSNIGVARILSGVHFFLKKLTTFLVVALKDRLKVLNEPPNLPARQKCPKIAPLSLGVHLTCWGALKNFPCKLRLFFLRPGGAGASIAPPGYTPVFKVRGLRRRVMYCAVVVCLIVAKLQELVD